ncbi:MAG: hypothetical protein JNK20_02580 [Flavipsychrobacter sp.]|nr:hypothetical protein [Flavipsychrobacter sp.]
MIEYLNCDTCTAIVSTEMTTCEYCGNDFRHSGFSSELIKLRDELDKKFYTLNIQNFLKIIESSKFKAHPIVKFRKAKALLIENMTNNGVLDAVKFCDVLYIIRQLKSVSADYCFEFVLYVSVIFPTPHTKLYLVDYLKIKSFLVNSNLDEYEIIDKTLREQVLVTYLGKQFFKDYYFYTNPKNFICNPDFIKKRDFLKEKYQAAVNKISKIN